MDTKVKDRLNKIDGVASVEIVGGVIREIQINVSREALIRHNLTITEFAGLIGAENKDVPLGRLSSEDEEFVLRVSGEFTSIEDIKNTTIAFARKLTDTIVGGWMQWMIFILWKILRLPINRT